MTTEEKLQVAEQLVRLNVISSRLAFPPPLLAILRQSKRLRGVLAASPLRDLRAPICSDIDAAWEAVRDAEQPVIHVFLATSDIHLKHKLKIDHEEALATVCRPWWPMRVISAPPLNFRPRMLRAAIGTISAVSLKPLSKRARPLSICLIPLAIRCRTSTKLCSAICANAFRASRDVVMSAHCHNDLGMATANTLAAIKAGARQVEVTINGLGERAGNTAMEEVVMALRTRPDFWQCRHAYQCAGVPGTSQLVSRLTGIPVSPIRPLLGPMPLPMKPVFIRMAC